MYGQLEKAVVEEMSTYKEEWESVLDDLEQESAYLLVYISEVVSIAF